MPLNDVGYLESFSEYVRMRRYATVGYPKHKDNWKLMMVRRQSVKTDLIRPDMTTVNGRWLENTEKTH